MLSELSVWGGLAPGVAEGGPITPAGVQAELHRLQTSWAAGAGASHPHIRKILGEDKLAKLDLFDRAQLDEVLRVSGQCATLTEAGRRLFAVSRQRKTNPNDADRLRKYLLRFDLKFADLK